MEATASTSCIGFDFTVFASCPSFVPSDAGTVDKACANNYQDFPIINSRVNNFSSNFNVTVS